MSKNNNSNVSSSRGFNNDKILLDNSIINDIIKMKKISHILQRMRRNPENVRFEDLCKVCSHYFGPPRQSKSNHRIFKTPWAGDPRINIQNNKGKTKAYQVRQVLLAVDKLEVGDDNTE